MTKEDMDMEEKTNMEEREPVFNAEEACAFILAKFREQGDFVALEGMDLEGMVACAQRAEEAYMRESGVLDGDVYDDDAAFERVRAALTEAFPAHKMYAMRFAEDYLDYSEEYLESVGLIDWE